MESLHRLGGEGGWGGGVGVGGEEGWGWVGRRVGRRSGGGWGGGVGVGGGGWRGGEGWGWVGRRGVREGGGAFSGVTRYQSSTRSESGRGEVNGAEVGGRAEAKVRGEVLFGFALSQVWTAASEGDPPDLPGEGGASPHLRCPLPPHPAGEVGRRGGHAL